MKFSSVLSSRWHLWAAGAFGVAWYLALGGHHTLNVIHIDWLIQGDWNMHLFSWLFARNAPWEFPLGQAPALLYPHGSSLAFADGMPWVGVFFKLLSPLLPLDFQPQGVWFLSCFVMQGVVGAKLATLFTKDKVSAFFTGMLLVLCPVLSARLAHPSLCAMWVLLALIYLHVKPFADNGMFRRAMVTVLLLVSFVSGIHMYLTAMVLALSVALLVRVVLIEKSVSLGEGAGWLGGIALTCLGTMWLLGFIGGAPTGLGAEGFGDFSSDLATFINPMGWSRVVPDFPVSARQGEGFAYLGLGVALLLGIRGVLWFKKRDANWHTVKPLVPLLVVAVAMALYALSFRVTVFGRPLFEVPALFRCLEPLPSRFRSSGRCMWTLHLWLVVAGVSALKSLSAKPALARGIIVLVFVLQLLDVDFEHSEFNRAKPMQLKKLTDERWSLMSRDYQHLAMHPLQLLWICRYDFNAMPRFSYEAYRQKLTFNSGHVARAALGIEKECEQHLGAAPLDSQTVYVVTPEFLVDFVGRPATCGVLEGYAVCVSNERRTALLDALEKAQLRLN